MQLNIYNTNFEAGTLVLMIFLYAYLRVKYYNKSAVNDALRRLVVVEIIATVMDLFSSITISSDAFPAWTNVLSNTLYYLALMTTSTMVVIYILAFIKDRPHYPRLLFASKAVLFILGLLVLINIPTGIICRFPKEGYIHGPLYWLLYAVPGLSILVSFVLIVTYRQIFTKSQKIVLLMILLFSGAGPLLQAFFFPNILLSNVTPAISMILALFTVVSPNYNELEAQRAELEERRNSLSKEVAAKTAEVMEKEERSELLSKQIIASLAETIDAVTIDKQWHTENVAYLSSLIAKELGLSRNMQYRIYCMGIVHDIGIVGVDEDVVLKGGKYTPEEADEMKKHAEIGYKILSRIEEMPEIGIGARCHHEHYDGTGYPEGLKGEDIPLEARIIGAADAYDGMTEQRSYKDALTKEEAIAEIQRCSGTQFDPRVARALTLLLKRNKYKPGVSVEDAFLKVAGKGGTLT